MNQRQENYQKYFNNLTHDIEQLKSELNSLKNNLQKERNARQKLEKSLSLKEKRWIFHNTYNPTAILVWEEKVLEDHSKIYVLKEYNKAAEEIFAENLINNIGISAKDIFNEQPEIVETIYKCGRKKTIIEYKSDQENYINFKCVFVSPQEIILYYLTPQNSLEIQQKLKHQIEQESTLSLLGKKALEILEISELMEETVNSIVKILKIKYCSILELLPNEAAFLLKAGCGWQNSLI